VDESQYWLGFSLVPLIGTRRFRRLLEAFGSAEAAWHATPEALQRAGLDGAALASLLKTRQTLDLGAESERVRRAGAYLLTLDDPSYPPLLAVLPDAPTVLYVKGTIESADRTAVAIVGTRRATTYGRDAAQFFARGLAQNGVTIVSGLAHGIDATAHRAAIEARGRTIAVLGCGIDKVYPRDHATLTEQIIRHGAVISEFPIGTAPDARNFPRRNRVISGISMGVLVVEAPEKSGAIITTTCALDQGRDVYAVPGNIFNPASAGTNRLIQDGAKCVLTPEDVLSELDMAVSALTTRQTVEQAVPDNPLERQVLEALSNDPLHVDEIGQHTGLPIHVVTSTLTILELKGLARMIGHMQYCLTL
jgi:DNA processing protein